MVHILVGMSGGVDSSVAALILQRQGCAVTGVTLRLRGGRLAASTGAGAQQDIDDARRVCDALGIEHRVLDLTDAFCRCVVDEFAAEYLAGRTPNPCVTCNRTIKFGAMLDYALENGMDGVATGHYARREFDAAAGRWALYRADSLKDQSYVLYSLTQEQLAHTLLPLGGMSKTEVREIARDNGFINAKKRESQDICFVPDGDYAAFIERYTGEPNRPGNFVDGEGRVLGRHRGFVRYTIGQRRGLGLSLREPLYVCAKRAADNTVILGRGEELFSKSLTASGINLIACERISSPLRLRAKVRYKQREQWATVEQTAEDRLRVDFDEPQRAVTPGQAVVLYDGSCVVGGGTIE